MASPRILVVDDEEDLLTLVRYNLVKELFRVTTAATGEEALARARADAPDLVILDLMLPGMDGLDVCRAMKADPATARIPIVMLTARGEDADVVAGLTLGADDYVTKPFSPRVLVARVRAVLRRREAAAIPEGELIEVGELTVSPGRREASVQGRKVELTATEFKLLLLLARRRGWVFTRAQIIGAVKGDDAAVTERAVDVQVVGLRRKLGGAGKLVETVRGIGYRMRD
ncbi:MAG: response regulator transcription factor [Deltaproteobacteria bacterium]|nr:response regulator transcription factor [Deltaproteobacteria bacterium]